MRYHWKKFVERGNDLLDPGRPPILLPEVMDPLVAVVPLFIPPHSSNQIQPLDLCAFGLTKKILRYNNMQKSRIQTYHILEVLDAFSQAARRRNITASFRNAGISLALKNFTLPGGNDILHTVCRVTVDKCRCLLRYFPQLLVDEEEEGPEFVPGEGNEEDEEEAFAQTFAMMLIEAAQM
jgi:hypothetical protein